MSGIRVRTKNKLLRKLGAEGYQQSENEQLELQHARFMELTQRVKLVAKTLDSAAEAMRAQRDAQRELALALEAFYSFDPEQITNQSASATAPAPPPARASDSATGSSAASSLRVCEKLQSVLDDANGGRINTYLDTLEQDVAAPLRAWIAGCSAVERVVADVDEVRTKFDHYARKMQGLMEQGGNGGGGGGGGENTKPLSASAARALRERIGRNEQKLRDAAVQYNTRCAAALNAVEDGIAGRLDLMDPVLWRILHCNRAISCREHTSYELLCRTATALGLGTTGWTALDTKAPAGEVAGKSEIVLGDSFDELARTRESAPVHRTGHLLKRGEGMGLGRAWRKKYLELHGHVVRYWDTEAAAAGGAAPRKQIELATVLARVSGSADTVDGLKVVRRGSNGNAIVDGSASAVGTSADGSSGGQKSYSWSVRGTPIATAKDGSEQTGQRGDAADAVDVHFAAASEGDKQRWVAAMQQACYGAPTLAAAPEGPMGEERFQWRLDSSTAAGPSIVGANKLGLRRHSSAAVIMPPPVVAAAPSAPRVPLAPAPAASSPVRPSPIMESMINDPSSGQNHISIADLTASSGADAGVNLRANSIAKSSLPGHQRSRSRRDSFDPNAHRGLPPTPDSAAQQMWQQSQSQSGSPRFLHPARPTATQNANPFAASATADADADTEVDVDTSTRGNASAGAELGADAEANAHTDADAQLRADVDAHADSDVDAGTSTRGNPRASAQWSAEAEASANTDADRETTSGAVEDTDCAQEDESSITRDGATVPVHSGEDDDNAANRTSGNGNARTFGGGRAGAWW